MPSEIHLVFATNRAYCPYLLIALDSAIRHASSPCAVHVLSDDLADEDKRKIKQLAKHHHGRASFPSLHRDDHSTLPNLAHFGTEAYLRFYGPKLIPDADRLLYFDCDVVILDDIAKLSQLDLEGCTIAAAPMLNSPYGPSFGNRFGYAFKQPYFNSGVLVIDANRWRDENAEDALLNWLANHRDEVYYPDQDALNAVFGDRYKTLPPGWNCESRYFTEKSMPHQDRDLIADATSHTSLIHYTGGTKPWTSVGYCPRRGDFWTNEPEVSRVTQYSYARFRKRNSARDTLRTKIQLFRIKLSHRLRNVR